MLHITLFIIQKGMYWQVSHRLIIQLEEGSEQRKEAQPYVFQITVKNPELDTIDLRINGQSTPIDRMTIM